MSNFLYTAEEFHELYEEVCEWDSMDDMILDIIKPKIGDCVIYDKNLNTIYVKPYLEIDKEQKNSVIGIVIQANDNFTMDCIMKNFISAEKQTINLMTYFRSMNNTTVLSANMKQLFDRYIQKYKREANMEFVKTINYYIPNVAQLDYIDKNKNIFINTVTNIYDEQTAEQFINRYYNGILSVYKNKMYIWKPNKSTKREILSLQKNPSCEFLPCFTVSYS